MERLHQKTRKELIEEVKKLKSLEVLYLEALKLYHVDKSYRFKTEPGAWDARLMIPLVEFCALYLKGADIKVGYRMVNQGKLDAHVIKYKYRDTDTNFRKFTLIPLTRKNLGVASNYNPSIDRRGRSIQRIVQLELDAKLDIKVAQRVPVSQISREQQVSVEDTDELT